MVAAPRLSFHGCISRDEWAVCALYDANTICADDSPHARPSAYRNARVRSGNALPDSPLYRVRTPPPMLNSHQLSVLYSVVRFYTVLIIGFGQIVFCVRSCKVSRDCDISFV